MIVVVDWEEWSVVPSLALPPVILHHELGCTDAPVGVLVLRNGPDQTPLEFAAWQGFAGVPAGILDRMLVFFEVAPKDRPKVLLEKIALLAKRILPAITQKQLAEILENRVGLHRSLDEAGSVLSGSNLEHADGIVDAADTKSAKEYSSKE